MLLLDTMLAHAPNNLCPNVTRIISANKFSAVKYFFSDETVSAMGNLMREYPNFLLNNMQFALPTYPVMYIEFSLDVFHKALGAPVSISDETRDHMIGYFVVNDSVFLLSNSFQHQAGTPGLFCYSLNGNVKPMSGILPIDVSENKSIFLFGTTMMNEKARVSPEMESFIQSQFHIMIDANGKNFLGKIDMMREVKLFEASVGEFRNLLFTLLWINQPRLTNVVSVPHSRGWIKNRNIVFSAHNVVSLKKEISKRTIMRAFVNRQSPRRHEVPPFFRNFEKNEQCEHDWPFFPDENGRWKCRRCTQWRIRVKEHSRGDASRGFVTKEYKA